MNNLKIFIVFVSILSLYACNSCQDKEIQRTSSPDGRVEVVMIERNCGATTGYSYRIYIVPKRGDTKGFSPIFEADRLDGENLQWVSPKLLEIRYKKARIFAFKNYWESREVDNFDYKIQIHEVQIQ
ncbi:MAG: hypothetical protein PHV60_04870 [bacterium]|nr:hypothetical protein [bacterium]